MTGSVDYQMCGWRVRSDLPLPELLAWGGDDRTPDLDIRLGPVPEPDQALEISPFLSIGQGGQCRLMVEDVARYFVRDGREIVVEPRIDPTSVEIRLFLLGTVLGLLCHQRGLFPLHASAILLDGAAVAFAGHSGAGKSTFAASMAQRGHPLLADDVCVIDPAAAGGPAVLPSFPRVKLWLEAMDALSIHAEGLDRNRTGQEKYHYRFAQPGSFVAGAVPLRAVYLLEEARPPCPESIETLQGFDAITALSQQLYRRRIITRMGREAAAFRAAAAIAAVAPVRRVIRYKTFDRLDAMARFLEGGAPSWPA